MKLPFFRWAHPLQRVALLNYWAYIQDQATHLWRLARKSMTSFLFWWKLRSCVLLLYTYDGVSQNIWEPICNLFLRLRVHSQITSHLLWSCKCQSNCKSCTSWVFGWQRPSICTIYRLNGISNLTWLTVNLEHPFLQSLKQINRTEDGKMLNHTLEWIFKLITQFGCRLFGNYE